MSDTTEAANGLFASLRRFLDTGLGAVHNRVELFAVELREERCRLMDLVLSAVAACFFAMLAWISVTATLVFMFKEHALFALIGFSLLHILGAVAAVVWLRKQLKHKSMPFAGSIAELKKDREWLQTRK